MPPSDILHMGKLFMGIYRLLQSCPIAYHSCCGFCFYSFTHQPPQKPVPYNKSRSPSPMHTSPVKSPPTNTNTPPPLPKKQKSIHKGNSSVSAAATGTRNLSSAAPTGHYSTPNIPVNTAHNAPPTLPESIPRTSSQDKKIHNYSESCVCFCT